MAVQTLTGPVRDSPPCHGCTEKFEACHDRCPKDLRGAYGYKAFRKQIEEVKAARAAYLKQKNIRYKAGG